MAKMAVGDVKVALAKDGVVTIPAADNTIVGRVVRDDETGKWTAAAADAAGKVGRKMSAHASRTEAFEALLAASGIAKQS